jgi:hypothetical protein
MAMMCIVKPLRALLLLLVVSWLLPATASAHGEEHLVLIEKQPLGPYQVSLLAAPGTVRVGEMHFMVVIKEQRHNRSLWTPALDQQVTIAVQPVDNTAEPRQVAALLIAEPPTIAYEATLTLPRAGQYQITVGMVDAHQVRRQLTTTVEARALLVFQGLIVALSSLTLLIAGWLVKEGVRVWRLPPYP